LPLPQQVSTFSIHKNEEEADAIVCPIFEQPYLQAILQAMQNHSNSEDIKQEALDICGLCQAITLALINSFKVEVLNLLFKHCH
jgi:hypothetical protein